MDNAASLQRARELRQDVYPAAPPKKLASRATRRRLRVVPWRGDPRCALIGSARGAQRPTVNDVRRAMDELSQQDISTLVTPAMTRFEAEVFYQAGFYHLDALHLLLHRLASSEPQPSHAPNVRITTARRWDLTNLLAIDEKAFEGFWRFDRVALDEARSATPSQFSRVAVIGTRFVGYAVTGRAGGRGYLQRLAVDPAVQGQGIGSALVIDAFRWLHRRGATTCLVNTQTTNTRALSLYEHLGFERQAEGLVVLGWDRVP